MVDTIDPAAGGYDLLGLMGTFLQEAGLRQIVYDPTPPRVVIEDRIRRYQEFADRHPALSPELARMLQVLVQTDQALLL